MLNPQLGGDMDVNIPDIPDMPVNGGIPDMAARGQYFSPMTNDHNRNNTFVEQTNFW